MYSDEEYECHEDVEIQLEPAPDGTTGLALAEHFFGPLLSPVATTPAQWTDYTEHRLGANANFRNIFNRRKKSICDSVALIEKELGLDDGTLQSVFRSWHEMSSGTTSK